MILTIHETLNDMYYQLFILPLIFLLAMSMQTHVCIETLLKHRFSANVPVFYLSRTREDEEVPFIYERRGLNAAKNQTSPFQPKIPPFALRLTMPEKIGGASSQAI